MKTTLYIPCYNAERTVTDVLASIAAQSRPPDEVLIVDDGSTDDTARSASEVALAQGRVIAHGKNLGLAAARNRAMAEANGDLLIGIDSDVCIRGDYVESVVARFEHDKQRAAICGRLIERHATALPDRWRAVHMKQHFGDIATENPRFLYGCTTSIRRDVAERVGGWDERFRRAYEDVDLTQRLQAAGCKIAYEPCCVAYHLRRDSVASLLTSFWHWFYPNGDLAGHFGSIDAWLGQHLEQVQWSLAAHRLRQDEAADFIELMPITLLMPWWMTALDLFELRRRHPKYGPEIDGALASLPKIAHGTVTTYLKLPALAEWMAAGLSTYVQSRSADKSRAGGEAVSKPPTSVGADVAVKQSRDRLPFTCRSHVKGEGVVHAIESVAKRMLADTHLALQRLQESCERLPGVDELALADLTRSRIATTECLAPETVATTP